MSCAKCGGTVATMLVSWSMSRGPLEGAFCEACASKLQHDYPFVTFTFWRPQESACEKA